MRLSQSQRELILSGVREFVGPDVQATNTASGCGQSMGLATVPQVGPRDHRLYVSVTYIRAILDNSLDSR